MANKQPTPKGAGNASNASNASNAGTGPDGQPVTKQPMSELDTIQMRMNQVTDEVTNFTCLLLLTYSTLSIMFCLFFVFHFTVIG